jgi:formylmethanofuran dehydrogenase subunit E
VKRLKLDPRGADLDAMVERGTLLHGHLGPFLVAGIRMGLLALELLDSDGYFGLRAESDAGSTTPISCLNDGIQIGSGCTTGKGNLAVRDGGRPVARFFKEDGVAVEISVRADAMAAFRAMEILAASEAAKRQPREELFEWRILSSS